MRRGQKSDRKREEKNNKIKEQKEDGAKIEGEWKERKEERTHKTDLTIYKISLFKYFYQ